jgi:predicted metal-dependent hydrolase
MRIDFKGVNLRWARNYDFSTIINSGSPLASAFEPYLNRIIARVRDALPENKERVRRDIDLFIAQEGHHYRVHNQFNRELYARYPKLKQFESEIAAAQTRMADTRSLAYNMAYCAGFENLACYMAKFTYEKMLPRYEGGDPRVVTLFLWHNAEEYEHRSACSDAFAAYSGNYFIRIAGFIAFMRLIMSTDKKIRKYMFEIDRSEMSPERRAESIRYERDYNRIFAKYVFPRMIKIFMPFYNPAKQNAPDALHDSLKNYDLMSRLCAGFD